MKVPVAVQLLTTVKKHIYDGFLTLGEPHKGKLVKNISICKRSYSIVFVFYRCRGCQ